MKFLTTKEAAAVLGVSTRHIQRLVAEADADRHSRIKKPRQHWADGTCARFLLQSSALASATTLRLGLCLIERFTQLEDLPDVMLFQAAACPGAECRRC